MIFRYQLSGSIFIGWLLIFYYSSNSASFSDIATKISALPIANLFSAVAAGVPIGTIIHQFSVSIKNQIFGKLFGFPYFIDSMQDDAKLTDSIVMKYIAETRAQIFTGEIINSKITSTHEKLSSLNTHYYLRFDNGVLAPIFAYLTFIIITAQENNSLLQTFTLLVLALIILVVITFIIHYIKRCKENKNCCILLKNQLKGKFVFRILFLLLLLISAIIMTMSLKSYSDYKVNLSMYYQNNNMSNISVIEESMFLSNNMIESIVGCCSYKKTVPETTYSYNYKSSMKMKKFNSNDIVSFVGESYFIEQVVLSKDGKKIIITPIDSNLLIFSLSAALLYMTLMVSYIPVIYLDRKRCWEYYKK